MPARRISSDDLDFILGLQLWVAWAGESGGEPPRLGWWDSDLVDEAAGGDLFARLLPRTRAWAGPEAAREAARQRDARARSQAALPEGAQTLYHFGFLVDEQLGARLLHHKRAGHPPSSVLPAFCGFCRQWSRSEFAAELSSLAEPQVQVAAGGRPLRSKPESIRDRAAHLAAALSPLTDTYPMPYLDREG